MQCAGRHRKALSLVLVCCACSDLLAACILQELFATPFPKDGTASAPCILVIFNGKSAQLQHTYVAEQLASAHA